MCLEARQVHRDSAAPATARSRCVGSIVALLKLDIGYLFVQRASASPAWQMCRVASSHPVGPVAIAYYAHYRLDEAYKPPSFGPAALACALILDAAWVLGTCRHRRQPRNHGIVVPQPISGALHASVGHVPCSTLHIWCGQR